MRDPSVWLGPPQSDRRRQHGAKSSSEPDRRANIKCLIALVMGAWYGERCRPSSSPFFLDSKIDGAGYRAVRCARRGITEQLAGVSFGGSWYENEGGRRGAKRGECKGESKDDNEDAIDDFVLS